MKRQTLKSSFVVAFAIFALSFGTAFAKNNDRTTEKTRQAVENASPHDWYTLARSAEKCFKKEVNLKEAAAWLDESLNIARTPLNLELKGDYFIMNKLPEKALDYYAEAAMKLKDVDGLADITHLQKKIAKIINIGG